MNIQPYVISILTLLLTSTRVVAELDSGSRSGEIHGQVNYCGLGGVADIEVYIPGRSFAARTDDNGSFRLSYVPAGEYRLLFRHDGARIGGRPAVRVQSKRITQLGAVNICPEAGGACPLIYEPVCGDNGVTYGNACEAQRAGVLVAYLGECQS